MGFGLEKLKGIEPKGLKKVPLDFGSDIDERFISKTKPTGKDDFKIKN